MEWNDWRTSGLSIARKLLGHLKMIVQSKETILDKLMQVLFVTFESQAPDRNLGGLKNQGKISQFFIINISFPIIGVSFEPKND